MKIVIIGGGSCGWSPKLLCDIIHEPLVDDVDIVLEDIDLKAAGRIRAAGERLAADNGKKLRFTVTDDEESAFRGADIILITVSTGGFTTMRPDVELPEKYGIFQAVGDTVGPGGWSRTLRNVPVFVKWAEKFTRLCPDAYILNYSNPMAALTGAFHAVNPDLKVIGLCHGPRGTLHYLARILETDVSHIDAAVGGVNHFFWITKFTVDGKDGYQMLKEKLAGRPLSSLDLPEVPHLVLSAIYEEFGYLTYTADNHTAEFLPGFLLDMKNVEKYKIFRKSIPYREENMVKGWAHVDRLISGEDRISEKSIEIAVEVMKALKTGSSYVDVVNLPNKGQISNLPMDAVVETFGCIGQNGFSPIAVGALPRPLAALTEVHCHCQLMNLEAAMTGNKKLAMESLMLDPLCHKLTFAETRQMGEELMQANKEWLPQFFKK